MINSIARVVPANFAVREGLRAVAIWVDPNQTAAGLVDVGDRVDVISTHKLSTAKQSTELYDQIVVGSTDFSSARTIAQDLEVLAVDKSITAASAPAPAAAAPGAPGAAPPPPPPPPPPANANQTARTRVVVATSPAVAATLVAANETGNLHITIRNPNSRERFPVAETRQYPSRVVNVPKPSAFRGRGGGGGNAGGGGGGDRGRRPPVDRIPYGPLPMDPSPGSGAAGVGTALPTGSMGGTPIPPPPSGSEVTVIRGTEKTRVIVPSR
jgi:Flp pilus assembly protein CpaB